METAWIGGEALGWLRVGLSDRALLNPRNATIATFATGLESNRLLVAVRQAAQRDGCGIGGE